MRAMWVRFAATGSPGPGWPKWDPMQESMLVFDTAAFPNPRTPRFATAQLPKATCQFMEAKPSTPTCGVKPAKLPAKTG